MGMEKRFKHGLIAIATALLCIVASPAIAHLSSASSGEFPETPLTRPRFTTAQRLVEQGRDRYESGQFQDAVRLLQQAANTHAADGQLLQQAIALSNLSLAYQALGDWDAANTAIETGLTLLDELPVKTVGNATVTAQALTIQGRLQFAQGQFQSAFDTWQQVSDYYQQQGEEIKGLQSRLNQIQALQAMGFYQQAIDQLRDIRADLATQPDSPTKVAALRNLGNALRVAGYFGSPSLDTAPFGAAAAESEHDAALASNQALEATTVLAQTLVLAQKLGLKEAIATTSIHLGDIAYVQALNPRLDLLQDDWFGQAKGFYAEAIAQSASPTVQTKARLRQMDIAIEQRDWSTAQRLRTQIQLPLQSVSPNRTTIYQQVQLAQALIRIKQARATSVISNSTIPPIQWTDIANLLATANQQAEKLGDERVQAYVLGTLGHVYEQADHQGEAARLTQQALQLSLSTNASDITYQWYWQLARLRQKEIKQEGNNPTQKRQEAITAYQQAIAAIQQLRVDLAAVDQEAQFSFRSEIEPIHRELVALLLEPQTDSTGNDIELSENDIENDIELARQTIEDLQLAELDNFFRESCLNAQDVDIDKLDQQAAVLYPIVLSDRLEVVLSLPNASTSDVAAKSSSATIAADSSNNQRTLRHFTQSNIAAKTVDEQVRLIRQQLTRASLPNANELKFLLAEMYDWLIEPFADELQARGTQTLVFVLDGSLRNIPMAALYDGDRYLIETYSIALTPGLQLTASTPPNVQELDVLLGGLSESRGDFPELENVEQELNQIATTVASSQTLFNAQFTNRAVQRQVNASSSPVVHLATHGNFGNQFDDTYLLTWDTRLNIRELSTLLQSSELNRRRPIELLVLSACQTAEGDNRAALGLAGMAVRSGARSTLATLWTVNDESTALLMQNFYDIWVSEGVTKAEALRRAQQVLLENPDYRLPYYWAPFVLLGNWL